MRIADALKIIAKHSNTSGGADASLDAAIETICTHLDGLKAADMLLRGRVADLEKTEASPIVNSPDLTRYTVISYTPPADGRQSLDDLKVQTINATDSSEAFQKAGGWNIRQTFVTVLDDIGVACLRRFEGS